MRIPLGALSEFVKQTLTQANACAEDVDRVTDNLMWNDLVGRSNHGVERLPILIKRLQAELIRSPANMKYSRLSDSVGMLDANDGFGQSAGVLATDRAVDLAKGTGIGAVGVRNSNFFGTGAYFVHRAADAGLISLISSNSFAKVAAHGGSKPVLGTNPFAFGVPRRDGKTMMVDMSTAGLAGSTVREYQRQGLDLPEGLVVDEDGQPITDPSAAAHGTLLPASGAKGFGLSLMVEVLSGVLTGAGISQEVGSLYRDFDRSGNSGHFFMVLDISRWMPIEDFLDRFETMAAMVLASSPQGMVRLPGEARWASMEENRRTGIPVEIGTRRALEVLADRLGIQCPWQSSG